MSITTLKLVFSPGKLIHSSKWKDGRLTMANGSFVCLNDHCIVKHKVLSRDKVSALATGLAGLVQVLIGTTFSCFDPKPTTYKINEFKKSAIKFCTEIINRPASRWKQYSLR